MKRLLIVAACGCAFGATGCMRSLGPHALARDRAQYSVSLADSWKEQTLLNIVKMRYLDPPIFIDVGNIVSSYSMSETVALGGSFSPSGSNTGSVAGTGAYTNSPTITYVPLTGSKFIASLMSPLPPSAIFFAIQAGLPADTIMFAALSSINGLKNQESQLNGITPADSDFHRVRALARKLQLEGAVKMYVKENREKEETRVVSFRTRNITPEVAADIDEMKHLLRLDPNSDEYTIVNALEPANGAEIAVVTRSILSLMQTMAAQVEVPPEDLAGTRAFAGFESSHAVPGVIRLVRIHNAKSRPANAYVAVYYRGSWFWIDDGDLETKQVFSLMMMLFTMAESNPSEHLPVITIPAH